MRVSCDAIFCVRLVENALFRSVYIASPTDIAYLLPGFSVLSSSLIIIYCRLGVGIMDSGGLFLLTRLLEYSSYSSSTVDVRLF